MMTPPAIGSTSASPRTSAQTRSSVATRALAWTRSSRERGFTLIEVLIAMLILAVGSASILSLFAAAAATHRRAVERTRATLLAEEVIAQAEALYEAGMSAQELLQALGKSLSTEDGAYRYEAEIVQPPDAIGGELVIRVSVRWQTASGESAERFHAWIIPRASPGGR